MRIEGNRQCRGAGRVGPGTQPLEEMLMSPMHPVEVADGDIRAASPGGKLTNVLDRDHQRAASSLEPAISTRRPEHP